MYMIFGWYIESHQCAGGTSKANRMLVLQPSQSVPLVKGHYALQHLTECCLCRPLKQSLSRKDIKCLTKLLVDSKSQKVVAVHMVGAEAAETVQVCLCGSAALDKSSCSSSEGQQFHLTYHHTVHWKFSRALALYCWPQESKVTADDSPVMIMLAAGSSASWHLSLCCTLS